MALYVSRLIALFVPRLRRALPVLLAALCVLTMWQNWPVNRPHPQFRLHGVFSSPPPPPTAHSPSREFTPGSPVQVPRGPPPPEGAEFLQPEPGAGMVALYWRELVVCVLVERFDIESYSDFSAK